MKPGTSISTYTTDHSHMETNVESVYNNGRTYQLIFHDVGDGVIAMTITGNGKTSSSVSCTQAIYSYPPKKHTCSSSKHWLHVVCTVTVWCIA